MKAAGMVPLTLNAADMKALVSYVSSLGGASASSAATSSASGSSSPALTKEESEGATIFKAHGCAGCHGVNGAGGTAAAPALAGTTLTPALLTTMLQHPTAAMQRGGMPPQSLTGRFESTRGVCKFYFRRERQGPLRAVLSLTQRRAGTSCSPWRTFLTSSVRSVYPPAQG